MSRHEPVRNAPQPTAHATPLRLSVPVPFVADTGTGSSANRSRPRIRQHGYLRQGSLPGLFRIHG